MKPFLSATLALSLLSAACNKQADTPSTSTTNTGTTLTNQPKPSSISVLINDSAMQVTSINYNHSYDSSSQTGFFSFSAQNSLQKVEGDCDFYYEYGGWDYEYGPDLTYSYRADSLSAWNTITAKGYGNIYFDALYAPLTDPIVPGWYWGTFALGKSSLNIKGKFYRIFR